MRDIYISPELSDSLNAALLILFGISILASASVLYCIYKVPSSHLPVIRRYLIYIQILSIIGDTHFDILFLFHPIFPVLGGYCNGLLCLAKVPITTSLGIVVFLIGNVGVLVIMCMLHRHQTLMLPTSVWKLNLKTLWAVHVILVLIFSAPGVSLALVNVDESDANRLIEQCPFNITWIAQRGFAYTVFEPFAMATPIIGLANLILIFSFISVISMFFHIIHILRNTSIHSAESTKRTLKSAIHLFTQLSAQFIFMLIPSMAFALSALQNTPIPFARTMAAIYISPNLSNFLNSAHLVLFCTSISASALVFFCFYKVPSSHQKGLRRYLIYLQILSIIYDIHFDLLFLFHPIFPVLGGYCNGLLCRVKVPIITSLVRLQEIQAENAPEMQGIAVALIANVGVALILCLFHRHQTLMLPSSRWKFDQRTVWLMHVVMVVLYSAPGVWLALIDVHEGNSDGIIALCPINISWIRDRGFAYVAFEPFAAIAPIVGSVTLILIFSAITVIAMLFHIFHVLRNTPLHSAESTKQILKSVVNLFIQLSTPFLFIIIPGEVFALSALQGSPIPFKMALISYYLLHLHTIFHSFLLISRTPAFRKFVLSYFQRSHGIKTGSLEILAIIYDIHFDILFIFHPICPVVGGYCYGLLCMLKVPIINCAGIMVTLVGNVGVAIFMSLFHRHQTLMLPLSRRLVWMIHAVLVVFFSVPGVSLVVANFDESESERQIDLSPFNITWIRQRGFAHAVFMDFPWTPIVIIVTTILTFSLVAVLSMFFHIVHVLRTSSTHSFEATRRTLKSVINLFIQADGILLSAPLLFIICPGEIFALSVLPSMPIPFEVALISFYVLHLHALFHSVLLISLTPAFRKFVMSISCRQDFVGLMSDIYISEQLSDFLNVACLALFCISTSGSFLVLFCFYNVPTSHQTGLRRYLINLQVITIIYDFHFDILFRAEPIFPVLGGYCYGLLCLLDVPLLTSIGITVSLIGNVGVATLMCLIHRHQTIILPTSKFKFDERLVWCAHGVMIIIFSVPGVSLALVDVDASDTERQIDSCPFNITWIRQRGHSRVVLAPFSWISTFMILVTIILIYAVIMVIAMFLHIIHVLRTTPIQSAESTQRTRKSVINLFIQLSAPFLLIIVPGEIVSSSVLPSMPIPFEVALISFYLLHLHTIFHSVLLISLTPTFRKHITSYFQTSTRAKAVNSISGK